MTYNTGNPLGSSDARDLFDNAQKLDLAMNSEDPTWTDRLGNVRPTFSGAESSLNQKVAEAAAIADSLDDRWLGAKAADPVTDNDGDPLQIGAGYYNTSLDAFRIYGNSGWYTPNVDGQALGQAAPGQGAALIGYAPTGQTVEYELGRKATRVINHGFAYDYSADTTIVYDGSTGDGLHRHFGQVAQGADGRLHLVYGRSPTHGLTDGQTGWYRYSDDGGATWSAETEVIPAATGFDQRSLSMCVTPSGRILLIYAKVIVPSATSNPTVYRLRYSDDNGETWVQGDDIATINYTYCRTYGRIKLVPGDLGDAYRLAFTPYHRSSDTPDYKVAAWYSSDDGETWDEGTPIINDTSGQNECELVAINAKTWFAVTRGATGLTLYKTTDGGAAWTAVGVVPGTTSDNQVAPTLDKFERGGRWHLVLGYCNRTTDDMRWRVALVDEALSSASAFGGEIIMATDMVNASGYQCPVVKPDGSLYIEGGTGYIEFKEYVGQVYTQVRFVRMDLFAKLRAYPWVLDVASGVITIPAAEFCRIIQVDTEGGASTDDLDTINGGRDGEIYVIQGPQATSARDVTLKTGTGNLDLYSGDFRINSTTSRIAVQKVGGKFIELGRTSDHTDAALTIASDAITVPSCSELRYFLIDTEGGAATDTLTTINGGREGQVIILMSASSSRDPTIAEGGNIVLDAPGGFTLSNVADTITLLKRSTNWYENGRSDNS
jgi:hypothetical protein